MGALREDAGNAQLRTSYGMADGSSCFANGSSQFEEPSEYPHAGLSEVPR